MIKSRLVRPTLFFVVSILMLLYILFEWIVAGGKVEGWLYRMVNLLLPIAISMMVIDVLLKYFLRSLMVILLVEALISLGIIYYWIVS